MQIHIRGHAYEGKHPARVVAVLVREDHGLHVVHRYLRHGGNVDVQCRRVRGARIVRRPAFPVRRVSLKGCHLDSIRTIKAEIPWSPGRE